MDQCIFYANSILICFEPNSSHIEFSISLHTLNGSQRGGARGGGLAGAAAGGRGGAGDGRGVRQPVRP